MNRLSRFQLLIVWISLVVSLVTFRGAVAQDRFLQTSQSGVSIPAYDPNNPWRIIDDAKLFNKDQMDRYQYDIRRAQNLGMPIIMYTRVASASAEQSQQVADAIRRSWNVESGEGADDGLVIVLTVHSTSRRGSSLVLSYGQNTFPKRQLTEQVMLDIYQNEMQPPLRRGDYGGALTWGIRRIDYYLDYTPPNPPALSSTEKGIQGIMTLWGALLPEVLIVSLLVTVAWFEKSLTLMPSSSTVARWLNIVLPIIAVSAFASVIGRSGTGALSSLGSLVAVGILVVVWSSLRPSQKHGSSSVMVKPRGTRATGRSGTESELRHG